MDVLTIVGAVLPAQYLGHDKTALSAPFFAEVILQRMLRKKEHEAFRRGKALAAGTGEDVQPRICVDHRKESHP